MDLFALWLFLWYKAETLLLILFNFAALFLEICRHFFVIPDINFLSFRC